jgi:hypothetical protein
VQVHDRLRHIIDVESNVVASDNIVARRLESLIGIVVFELCDISAILAAERLTCGMTARGPTLSCADMKSPRPLRNGPIVKTSTHPITLTKNAKASSIFGAAKSG